MGRIQRQEREALAAKLNPPQFKIDDRVQFIDYLFENICKEYLKTGLVNPYQKSQTPRAIALLWFYLNYANDIPKHCVKDLVNHADLLKEKDPTILSIAPSQFAVFIIRYFYYTNKETLSDVLVLLKAGNKSKVEEAYQYMMLAARYFKLQQFEGLANYYQNSRHSFLPYLYLVMLMSWGSANEKKNWYLSANMNTQSINAGAIKDFISPTLHHLKNYLQNLFRSLTGKIVMNNQDPFILFPIDEELASSVRQMKKFVPL